MARKLKVYCMNADGKHYKLVAVTTKKAAIEAFGCSAYSFSEFGHETWNDEDVAAAMSKPGTVFMRLINSLSGRAYTEA
jgi:hypothetical protein